MCMCIDTSWRAVFSIRKPLKCVLMSSPAASPCLSNPCENGGTCVEAGSSNYTCQCAEGFQGTNCEVEATPSGGLGTSCSSRRCGCLSHADQDFSHLTVFCTRNQVDHLDRCLSLCRCRYHHHHHRVCLQK